MERGDKQGRAFLQEETQTMVGRPGWQPVPSVCPRLRPSVSFHPCNLPLPRGPDGRFFWRL